MIPVMLNYAELNQKGIWQGTERVIPEAHPLYSSPTPFFTPFR